MSWLRRSPRVRPSSAAFHARRQRAEGFRKPYFEDDPVFRLYKYLIAYPVRGQDLYYSSLAEYTDVLIESALEVMEELGEEKLRGMLLGARRHSLTKDPPLVAAHVMLHAESVADVLAEYPVPKLLLFAELARKKLLPPRASLWGRMKKRAIAWALARHGFPWHEHQAIKYPARYRDLLKMVHPRPPDPEVNALWAWLTGRAEPPTKRTRAYERVRRSDGSPAELAELAIEHGLPWEALRSRVGLKALPPELVARAAEEIMTPLDIAMQANTLARLTGPGLVAELARRKPVPYSYAARAALGARDAEVAEAFYEKAAMPPEEFRRLAGLLGWRPRRVVALVDTSGSMAGAGILAAARIHMSLRRVLEKTYEFNGCAGTRELALESLEDYRGLLRRPDCGTPLYSAMRAAILAERLGEDDLLVVLTDEMENASPGRVEKYLPDYRRTNTAVVNVAAYPVSMLPKDGGSIVSLPGPDPDAVIGAARILELHRRAQTLGAAEVRGKIIEVLGGGG